MKKYKKTLPIISPVKVAIAALYAAIATVIVYLLCGIQNVWIIICGGICATLITCDAFVVIPTGYRYSYGDDCIKLSYLSIVYRKLIYSNFKCILISNASYNNGYGLGVYGNIPMQYTVKGNNGHTKVTLPFITLHKPSYLVDKIETKMNSRDLFMLGNDDVYCLGICWFDSLTELLNHTQLPVYVLEDVYLRFKGKFDEIFTQHEDNRCFIITDRKIEYRNYLGGDIK